MSELWIPLVGIVFGCGLVVTIVIFALNHKLHETRMRIEIEMQQMEMAYQRARASLSR